MRGSAGRRYAPFFEMIDLFDTVVELAGLPPPPDSNDGTSAAHAFNAPELRPTTSAMGPDGATVTVAVMGKDPAFSQ